ncbi:hypothetical protein CEUSTIGMA_g4443.t1 [Chlamydomonas eustigma]|uniref:Uncharacterized protein n=1 Tax=Chlamydomonas eustigma TaxID=1157962 RepID=A0A250X1R4_9CHLO|nr:hypothetical protein CEUSTIGMA_g4443.t1 [Chlamydomonas eustigma]|eukprot:GAX76996.1 hypothetical protein CEUSTIGMA_g4443.t1 [Chlamydomonas eustigma]
MEEYTRTRPATAAGPSGRPWVTLTSSKNQGPQSLSAIIDEPESSWAIEGWGEAPSVVEQGSYISYAEMHHKDVPAALPDFRTAPPRRTLSAGTSRYGGTATSSGKNSTQGSTKAFGRNPPGTANKVSSTRITGKQSMLAALQRRKQLLQLEAGYESEESGCNMPGLPPPSYPATLPPVAEEVTSMPVAPADASPAPLLGKNSTGPAAATSSHPSGSPPHALPESELDSDTESMTRNNHAFTTASRPDDDPLLTDVHVDELKRPQPSPLDPKLRKLLIQPHLYSKQTSKKNGATTLIPRQIEMHASYLTIQSKMLVEGSDESMVALHPAVSELPEASENERYKTRLEHEMEMLSQRKPLGTQKGLPNVLADRSVGNMGASAILTISRPYQQQQQQQRTGGILQKSLSNRQYSGPHAELPTKPMPGTSSRLHSSPTAAAAAAASSQQGSSPFTSFWELSSTGKLSPAAAPVLPAAQHRCTSLTPSSKRSQAAGAAAPLNPRDPHSSHQQLSGWDAPNSTSPVADLQLFSTRGLLRTPQTSQTSQPSSHPQQPGSPSSGCYPNRVAGSGLAAAPPRSPSHLTSMTNTAMIPHQPPSALGVIGWSVGSVNDRAGSRETSTRAASLQTSGPQRSGSLGRSSAPLITNYPSQLSPPATVSASPHRLGFSASSSGRPRGPAADSADGHGSVVPSSGQVSKNGYSMNVDEEDVLTDVGRSFAAERGVLGGEVDSAGARSQTRRRAGSASSEASGTETSAAAAAAQKHDATAIISSLLLQQPDALEAHMTSTISATAVSSTAVGNTAGAPSKQGYGLAGVGAVGHISPATIWADHILGQGSSHYDEGDALDKMTKQMALGTSHLNTSSLQRSS